MYQLCGIAPSMLTFRFGWVSLTRHFLPAIQKVHNHIIEQADKSDAREENTGKDEFDHLINPPDSIVLHMTYTWM